MCERQRNVFLKKWLEGLKKNKLKNESEKIKQGKGTTHDIRNTLIEISVLVMGFGNLMQVLRRDYKKKKNVNVKIWKVGRPGGR